MPKKDDILNLPYLTIKAVKGSNPILIDIESHQKLECIYCKSSHLRKKDSFVRKIRHESVGLKQTTLRVKTHKYQCKDCKRYFNQRLPGVRSYQRATERLKEQVFIQHTQGISQQDLAHTFKCQFAP